MRWRWGIIAIIVGIFLLNIYLTRTIVFVTVAKPVGIDNIKLVTTNKDGIKKDIVSLGSLALVYRDTGLLTASSGDLSTSTDISPLPWFDFKKVTLTLERDKDVDKVSGNNLGCSVYARDSNKLTSFSCTNPFGLFAYRTSSADDVPWLNKQVLGFPQAYNAAAFHNGVMGIANNVKPWLFYADTTTQKVTAVRLPVPNMTKNSLGSISVVADSSDPTQKHFLLADNSTGIIWYGQQDGENVNYRKYEHKISESGQRFAASKCTLVEKTAYCYFGNTSASPDSEGESIRHEQSEDGTIDIIDFSKQDPDAKQFIVSKENPIDHIYTDDSGQIYGYTESVLYTLKPDGNQFNKVVLATDVGAVSGGKSLYYIKSNKLFEYKSASKTTDMRFLSNNLQLSNINLFGDTVFVNAYIKKAPGNTLHTFKLLNEPNTTPGKRLVDVIPTYPTTNQANIIDMDYEKNVIHVVLPKYYEYRSGKLVPSISVYNGQKSVIRNYLSGILPSINKYTITFSYADKQ